MLTVIKVLIYGKTGELLDEMSYSDPGFIPDEELHYCGALMERATRKEYFVGKTKMKVFSYYPKRERRAVYPYAER